MLNPFAKASKNKQRAERKRELWPDAIGWEGAKETGYFCSPRTLPFLLRAMCEKKISGAIDLRGVYLELLANHYGDGIVELGIEDDHAYAGKCGSAKEWRKRLKMLEDAGFIRTKTKGKRAYAYILIEHPTVVMEQLHRKGVLPEELWIAYRDRQDRSGQKTLADLGVTVPTSEIEDSEGAGEEILLRPN
jgi:hypothetical protein